MFGKERRNHPRNEVAMPARVRKVTCDMYATIRDLSVAGCHLHLESSLIQVGNRVLIRPEGFESLLGTVIWTGNGAAGVEFDALLDQITIDNFCAQFPEHDTAAYFDLAA